MNKEVVAKRYALALFEIAKERQLLDQFEEEIRIFEQVFTENPKLVSILKHPKLAVQKKKALLQETFASLSTPLLNTLMILLDRHRVEIVPEFANEFIALANEERSVAEATVYSVRPLTEDEKQALSSVFAHKIGKATLRIHNVIDTSLIGGVKLRIGHRIYDGSVSGQLERLQRQLIG